MRTIVLGLGNELAGDDAVGIVAARRVRERVGDDVDVIESSASGLALLELLSGYDRAVILDAIRTGDAAVGAVVEMDLSEVGRVVAPSLHRSGLAELAAVAQRTGLPFPASATVLAVEVADPFTLGAPMSPAVAEAVDRLVERVERWLTPDRPTLPA